MKTKKAIFFLFVFLSYIPVLAQVDTAWVRRYNGPSNGREEATALFVDSSGNVYVTGHSIGPLHNYDFATIKYTPNGDTLWARSYNGIGNSDDEPQALAVDKDGNVYVTGWSIGLSTSYDYVTIKYRPEGDTVWIRHYNDTVNGINISTDIAVDDSGYVYVTGNSGTIKYAPNGDTVWLRNSPRYASSLEIDGSGNLYVTGSTSGHLATSKYTSSGDIIWSRNYSGLGVNKDGALAMAVDEAGYVYVTGVDYDLEASGDYVTIKYTSQGDTVWLRQYNGPGNGYDRPADLTVDQEGNVYVTGNSPSIRGDPDYTTIKYAPNGNILWVRRYGAEDGGDFPSALALDVTGNLYVTGASWNGLSHDYATIKYSPIGDILWSQCYQGPVNYTDEATDLAIDEKGNVYVTGRSSGYATSLDYTTIKYVQFDCIAKSGDANSDNNVLLPDVVTIINFLFKSQPAPNPSCRADANADGNILLSDIVYLINFLFKSGPVPQKSRECCL